MIGRAAVRPEQWSWALNPVGSLLEVRGKRRKSEDGDGGLSWQQPRGSWESTVQTASEETKIHSLTASSGSRAINRSQQSLEGGIGSWGWRAIMDTHSCYQRYWLVLGGTVKLGISTSGIGGGKSKRAPSSHFLASALLLEPAGPSRVHVQSSRAVLWPCLLGLALPLRSARSKQKEVGTLSLGLSLHSPAHSEQSTLLWYTEIMRLFQLASPTNQLYPYPRLLSTPVGEYEAIQN